MPPTTSRSCTPFSYAAIMVSMEVASKWVETPIKAWRQVVEDFRIGISTLRPSAAKKPFLLATHGPMYPTVLEVVPRIRYFPSPALANGARAGCVKRQKRNAKDKKRKVMVFMVPPHTILIQPFFCPSIQHLRTYLFPASRKKRERQCYHCHCYLSPSSLSA